MAQLADAAGSLRTPVWSADLHEWLDAARHQVDDAALHLQVAIDVEQRVAADDPSQASPRCAARASR